jgi:hypothetical protein
VIKIMDYLDADIASKLENLLKEKTGGRNRIVLSIIGKTKKNQQKFYRDISFLQDEIDFSDIEIEELIEKKILKFLSRSEGRLTLTLKGLLLLDYWILNPTKEVIEMIDGFNSVFFEKIMQLAEKPLTSKEKAIIITVLGLGAISDEYVLKVEEKNAEYFKKAVNRAAEFIESLGKEYCDGTIEKLWTRNVVGEGPILGEMRRTNQIPQKTEGIYTPLDKGHYLEILDNGNINETKLEYLIKKVFDKKPLLFDEKKAFIEVLNDIQKYEYKIFKINPPFDTLEIKKQIKRTIEKV